MYTPIIKTKSPKLALKLARTLARITRHAFTARNGGEVAIYGNSLVPGELVAIRRIADGLRRLAYARKRDRINRVNTLQTTV